MQTIGISDSVTVSYGDNNKITVKENEKSNDGEMIWWGSTVTDKYFFEEAVTAEINRIHREMHELEIVGRIGDLVVPERCLGNL